MELRVDTTRRTEFVDVTKALNELISGSGAHAVLIFVPHTTAGIVIQASGEGARYVAPDLEAAFERLVAENADWQHTQEGDRNPWAHVRAALTAASVFVPVEGGRLALGDLQAVFLCEFDGPRTRTIRVTSL